MMNFFSDLMDLVVVVVLLHKVDINRLLLHTMHPNQPMAMDHREYNKQLLYCTILSCIFLHDDPENDRNVPSETQLTIFFILMN